MKYSVLTGLAILFCVIASAQDSLRVGVIANVKKDMIQLRWGVNTPMAWKQTNQYGFRLERFTVVRNNEILATPEKVILVPQLKPQPLNNWESLATKNNYAAVVAQALYGKDFQLSGDDAKGVSKFMALAQELEQRYMIAMYAADLCYPAALLAGWGYEDKSVKPGERYLYRVTALTPEKVMHIEPGSAYTSLNEVQSLPQPQEVVGVFGDKSVMLTWNYGILDKVYLAYYVEKSYDGKSFTRLSELPLTNMNSKEGVPSDRMFYIDSLKANGVAAYYRVIGVTSFSEEGPASDTLMGKGVTKLIYVPHITRAMPNLTGGIDVSWEFDERGNVDVKSFELQRANSSNGPFIPVVSGIAPDKRIVTYDSLYITNYFVISAVPKYGEPVQSFPVLVQPPDSIPPAVPTGLAGVVDSLGVVKLTWNKNNDKDILGYQIYRAQTEGEELVPLTSIAVRENMYHDTIDVRNLNSKIYYAITAVDQRYNQSEKSETVRLQKPDLVPPSPPLFTKYESSDKGIVLEWVTGGEENIGKLCLYRKEKTSDENKLIVTFNDTSVKQFTDSTVTGDRTYQYSITAVTAGGLSSPPSPPVAIRASMLTGSSGNISTFEAKVNRKSKHVEISWRHNLAGVKQFELYRGEAGKGVSLWKVVKAYEVKMEDREAKPGQAYEYIIRAIMENGKTGAVSKTTTDKG
jgi:uncharacterized protein